MVEFVLFFFFFYFTFIFCFLTNISNYNQTARSSRQLVLGFILYLIVMRSECCADVYGVLLKDWMFASVSHLLSSVPPVLDGGYH